MERRGKVGGEGERVGGGRKKGFFLGGGKKWEEFWREEVGDWSSGEGRGWNVD